MQVIVWKNPDDIRAISSNTNVTHHQLYLADVVQLAKQSDPDLDVNDLYRGFWWTQTHVTSYAHAQNIIHQLVHFAFGESPMILFSELSSFWDLHTSHTLQNHLEKKVISQQEALDIVTTTYNRTHPNKSLSEAFSYLSPMLFEYHTSKSASVCFLPCEIKRIQPSYFKWIHPLLEANISQTRFLLNDPLEVSPEGTTIYVMPESVLRKVLGDVLSCQGIPVTHSAARKSCKPFEAHMIDELIRVFAPLSGTSTEYSEVSSDFLRNTNVAIDRITSTDAVQTLDVLVKPTLPGAMSSITFQNHNVFGMFRTSPNVFAVKWNDQYKVHTNVTLNDEIIYMIGKTLPDTTSTSLSDVCVFAFQSDVGVGRVFLYSNGIYRIVMSVSLTRKLELSSIVQSIQNPIRFIVDQVNQNILVSGYIPIFDEFLLNTRQVMFLKYSLKVALDTVQASLIHHIKQNLSMFPGYVHAKSKGKSELFIYNPHLGKVGGVSTKDMMVTIAQTLLDDATNQLSITDIEEIIQKRFQLAPSSVKEVIEEAKKANLQETDQVVNVKMRMKRKDVFMFWLEELGITQDKKIAVKVISSPSQWLKNNVIRTIKSCTIIDKTYLNKYRANLQGSNPPMTFGTPKRSPSYRRDDSGDEQDDLEELEDDLDFDDVYGMYTGGEGGLEGPAGAHDIGELADLRKRNKLDIMPMLHEADKNVFTYGKEKNAKNNYSRTCQGSFLENRQPIVITPQEKEYIDQHYPKAYTYAYRTGTFPKCKENYFICPSWWCEGNRVALSNEDLLKLKDKGYKCPKGPQGSHVDEYPYYLHGDKFEGKMKYPRGMNNRNPNNKIMPCCFVLKNHNDPKKIKEVMSKVEKELLKTDCVDPSTQVDDKHLSSPKNPTPSKKKTTTKKKTNIKEKSRNDSQEDDQTPIPSIQEDEGEGEDEVEVAIDKKKDKGKPRVQGRKDYVNKCKFTDVNNFGHMGSLPILLSKYFRNQSDDADNQGNTTLKTNRFVRNGVTSSVDANNGFLSCVFHVLSKSRERESTLKEFIDRIIKTMPIKEYILLNNGNTVKKYYDERESPLDLEHFHKFQAWRDRRLPEYIQAFKLARVYDVIHSSKINSIEDIEDEDMKLKVLREYYVYNSFQSFCRFLKDDSIPKTHVDVMGMFLPSCQWINPQGIRFVVMSATGENDIHIACDPYSVPDHDISRPIALVYHTDENVYEVISHLYYAGSAYDKYNILYKSYNDDTRYASILQQQRSYCNPRVNRITQFLAHVEKEDQVFALIMDYTFCIIGVITRSKVFVPLLQENEDLFTETDVRRMGMSLVRTFQDLPIVYITEIMHIQPSSVAKKKMEAHVKKFGFVGSLSTPNGLLEKTNEQIFAGYNVPIPYIGRDATPSEIVHSFIEAIRRQPDLTRKISLLQSSINPMSSSETHNVIKEIVQGVLGDQYKGVHKDDLDVAVDRIVSTDLEYYIGNLYQNVIVHKDETYYSSRDIPYGAIDHMLLHIKNPFRNVLYTMQDNMVHRNISSRLSEEVWMERFATDQCQMSPVKPAIRRKDLFLDEKKFMTAICKDTPTDIYGLFEEIAKILGNFSFEKETIHIRIERRLHEVQTDKENWLRLIRRMRGMGSFAPFPKVMNGNESAVTVKDVMSAITHESYHPSSYDVMEIAIYLYINVLIVGESRCFGILNDRGFAMSSSESHRYILLQMSFDDKTQAPVYYPILYHRKLILSSDDLGEKTMDVVLNKASLASSKKAR